MNAKKYIFTISSIIILLMSSCSVDEPGVLNPILINKFLVSANGVLEPNSTVQILAEAHSTLGAPLTYNFSIASGGGTLTSSTNAILPNMTFFTVPAQGGPTYILLTVTDNQGNQKQETCMVWTKKTWTYTPMPSNATPSEEKYHSMCVTPDNKPYVTFQDWSLWKLAASCMEYDGSSWSFTANGSAYSTNRAYYIHTVAGTQYPYATFLKRVTGTFTKYPAVVYRYTGTNWIECIPGATFYNSTQAINRPKLAFSPDNTLYLATLLNNQSLAIMRLTSTNWLQVGTNMTAATILDISLTIDRNNNPVVAYIGGGYLVVKQRSGQQWVDLGPSKFVPERAQGIMLTTCKKGTIYIAYQLITDSKIYVQKFVDGQWKMVGSGAATPGTASYANILFDSANTLHLIFKDGAQGGKVSARRFDGVTWQYTGQPGASYYEAESISAAIAPDDTIYAAFRRSYSGGATRVMILK